MRIKTTLKIEPTDRANLREFHDAIGLINYHALPALEQLVFGRIKGGDGFTLGDVEEGLKIVRRRRDEIHENTVYPFMEHRPGQGAEWLKGNRQSADHASD